MRALREPDAFPAADVGLMRALTPPDGPRPSAAEVLARAEAWRPWRAYACFHLWASLAQTLQERSMTDKPPERLLLDRFPTPVGEALIVTDEEGFLRGFDWSGDADRLRKLMKRYYPTIPLVNGAAPEATRKALADYFAGDLTALDGLKWRTAGTDFQRTVWRALCDIPVGETISYGELAGASASPRRCARWAWPTAPTRSA